MLRINGLTKRYRTGDLALKGIDLAVPDGQVMALMVLPAQASRRSSGASTGWSSPLPVQSRSTTSILSRSAAPNCGAPAAAWA